MRGGEKQLYEFGPFRLDVSERLLVREGAVVPVTPRVFDLLLLLIRNRGRALSKEELMSKLWPDTAVEYNNLTVNMSALRKALGDNSSSPLYIETVPRRGYRFVASVKELGDGSYSSEAPAVHTSTSGWPALEEPAATFVGREQELERLDALLDKAVEGQGRIIFITGEPGIGKTSLAGRFVRRARASHPELIFSIGRCLEQYGTGEAYLPFLDAIGALLLSPEREPVASLLRTFAPTWCLQFPAAFAPDTLERLERETIGATKERMLREMGDALSQLARVSPVVMLIEDLHWADPSSTDLLRLLGARIERQRLLVVGTFRPEEVELGDHPLKNLRRELRAHNKCEEITLRFLDEQHIADYLDARFSPNDFPRELAGLVQRKTEGHPLFATSLIEFLAERGDIARAGDRWALTRPIPEMGFEIPEGVRGMIRKKIESLDEQDRLALRYASVEGEEFTSTVLAALLGADELALEERLGRLVNVHRLIEIKGEEELPDGHLATRYRFIHVLYQNLLYEDLVSKRRIALHRKAGEHLERRYGEQAPRIAAQLAMHFERGREFRRAVDYLTHAGDNAARLYANRGAEEYYSRALALIERLTAEEQAERRLLIRQKRGAVYHAMSLFDRALEDFTYMLDEARALGARALEGAALNALAHTLFFVRRLDDMEACAREALDVASESGDEALRAETLAFIARRHVSLGNLTEARQMLDESIQIATALGHKPALVAGMGWRGLIHFFQSEYDQAEQDLNRVLALSLELRDGFMALFCHYFLGLTRANLGRMSEALATFNEATEMAQRNGDRNQSLKIPNAIGWIHRELEDHEYAIRHDREGVEVSRKHNVLEAEINSVINLGYDHTQRREGEKARSAFSEAEALLGRDDWLRWRFNLRLQAGKCEHLLARGDARQAEEAARQLFESASHYQARKYMVIAHRLLAESASARGDLTGAEAELQAAIEILREYPIPIVAWKVYAALGKLRRKSGDGRAAREAFENAASIVRLIAANVHDERIRETFLNSAAVREVCDRAKSARAELLM